MVSTVDIIHEGRSCIGTPFQHQGRLKGAGLDCIGLVMHCARVCELDTAKTFLDRPYGRIPNGAELKSVLSFYLEKIWDVDEEPNEVYRTKMRQADVLMMAWKRVPMHVGYAALTGYGWNVLHAYSGHAVCEHTIDDRWWRSIKGVFRFKEFTCP